MEKNELDRLIARNRNSEEITEEETPALWKEGDVIQGVFEISGFLGQGGIGKVFRVHHKLWEFDLAAKVPLLSESDDSLYENVVREAQTWIHLGIHPNIASCYFVKKFGRIPVIFMDYVDSGSLSDFISDRRLYENGMEQALRRILDIAVQFAWGLHHAHKHGVVHKDVKPGNVLISSDGTVKMTDFGISAMNGDFTLRSGSFALSAAYCSPEQALLDYCHSAGGPYGEIPDILPQSDMWGWALSVLEMFTGERTWSVGQAAAYVLEDYLSRKSHHDFIPEMPENLALILKRCFMARPEDRFKSMEEIVLRLNDVYRMATGGEYPRKEPETVDCIADNLNNRAASQMEIGNTTEAVKLWEEALRADANHAESLYNYSMLQWRAGIITDRQAIDRVSKAVSPDSPLLQKMYFEKRDFRTLPDGAGKAAASWRCKMNYSGYAGYVNGLFADPPGNRLVSTAEDGVVLLWSLNEGTLIRRLDQKPGIIRCSCAEPSLEKIFVGIGNTIYALYTETGRRGTEFHGHRGEINAVLFIDNRLISAAEDRTLKYWDAETGDLIKTVELGEGAVSLCVFEGGESISAGFADGTIGVFRSGREAYRIKAHEPGSVALSEKRQLLLSGGREGLMKLWDLHNGRLLCEFAGHRGGVMSVCLGNEYAVSGGCDRTVRIWDIKTGRCISTFDEHHHDVSAVLYDDEHHFCVTGGRDLVIKYWEFPPHDDIPFSPAISGARENRKMISDAGRFSELLLQAYADIGRNDFISALENLVKARNLPGFRRNPEVLEAWRQLCRGLSRKEIADLFVYRTFDMTEYCGKEVLWRERNAAGLHREGNMVLWDGEPKNVCLPDAFDKKDVIIGASQDARFLLACGQDKTVKLWDSQKKLRAAVIRLDERAVLGEIAPDASLILVAGSSGAIHVMEPAKEKPVSTLSGHSGKIKQIRLSDNLRYALTCSGGDFWGVDDNTARLWDLKTGKCLNVFTGHTGGVNAAVMTQDGRRIISAGGDGTVRIWNASEGECERILKGHSGAITAMEITKDGHYIFTSGADKTIRLWNLKSFTCEKIIPVSDTVLDMRLEKQDSGLMCRDSSRKISLWFIEWNYLLTE